jgi:tRNA 2-thiouridine synthesizing protein E
VLRWIRQDFLATGASPNVRRVAGGSGVGTRRMYELFPRTPGKTAAMLAGVPKPIGCV